MKRWLIVALGGILSLVLVGVGFAVYLSLVVGRQFEERTASISSISGTTLSALGYQSRNGSIEGHFEVATERDVQVHTWQMNLWGSASASIAAADGTIVFQETLDAPDATYQVHLEAGRYTVTTHFANAFAGGCVVGVDYELYDYLTHLPVLLDTDGDGLSDEMEEEQGTDTRLVDTDGDSLSDYAEVVKYRTNPLATDSDGDGAPDGDWDERREYAYTIYVSLLLRQPFDLEAMNDIYQDVRAVAGPDEAGYTHIEAITYPDTRVIISASVYPLLDLAPELETCTRPGVATNYDAGMQAEVLDIVAVAATDVQAVERVLRWVSLETTNYLDYSIPEVYFTYLDDGEVKVRNYADPLPVDELLRTHYFAASMFRERVHGTCTSIATLKCAMLKAAGIPCRVIQTIFPIYYHGSQTLPYTNNLDREWDNSLEQPPGENLTFANHGMLEVYLGGQWTRVDGNIGTYFDLHDYLSLKILAVADWSEIDFSTTWPVDWINDRPYYTLLIEDQSPQH